MSVEDGSSVPAGWYPDPADAARLRRWDGTNWTPDVVLAKPVAPVTPPAPATPPAAPPAAAAPPPATPMPPAYQPFAEAAPEAYPAQATATPKSAPTSEAIPIPDWANVPGLTLPPDLSAFAGFSNDSVLKHPQFDDPAMFDDPAKFEDSGLPSAAPPVLPRPMFEEPSTPAEVVPFESEPPGSVPSPAPTQSVPTQSVPTPSAPSPSAPTPSAPTPSAPFPSAPTRSAPGTVPERSATPYAPPPSGSQFSAPPPPGVVHTPPAPGVALHPSVLPLPPVQAAPVQAATVQAASRQDDTIQSAGIADPKTVPSTHPAATRGQLESPGSGTLGVWMLAALPLLQFAVVYAVFGVLAQPLVPGIQWGILVVPAFFSLLFAAADRKKLLDNGHDETPNVVLGILAPLYLIARIAIIGPKSIAPLVLWVVLQAAAVVGVLVLLPAVIGAAISSS